MTPRARILASALVAVCLIGSGALAFAQDPPRKRVVVLKFTGTQAQRARAAVVGGLGRWATLVDEDEFSAALSRARGATRPDKIAAACRTVGVDAVVEGTMHRSRRTWGVEVVVRNCENGEKMAPGGRAVYSMRNLGGIGVIRGTIWDKIGDAIASSNGGGGGTRVASSTRSRSRSSPPPPARSVTPSRTTSTSSRTSSGAAMQCLFTEDEPPEGFPSHASWVRRRNEFIVNCERERTRRIAEERRRREEAARRAEEERQRRIEEERLAREAEARRQREEEERRRREEEDRQRRIAEEADRRRREAEERRLEAERIEREARRRAEDDRRREDEARLAEERRRERDRYGDGRRRREEEDLERRVEEYREELRSERGMRADAADISSRSDVEPRDYEEYRDDRDSYRGDRDSHRDDRERSERDYDDRDPVYDPSRDDEEEDRGHRDDRDDRDEERDRDRDQDEEEEEEDEPEPRSARRRRPVIFDIGAGVAFMSRNMTVEQAGADKPRTYSAPGYPELTVQAEFFPVALASPTSGAAGLGVFGLYRRHLFLETSGPTDLGGEPIQVPTSEQELLVGAMFRTAMGRSPTSPIISLAAGYGYFAFELDAQAMSLLKDEVQMPTMLYRNLVVNAGLTIPISGSSLGVEVGGAYRYVVDVGKAARDLFGADTTGGNGFAGRAALGGEATFIAEGVAWSLSGEYTVFSTKFSGASSAEDGLMDAFPSGTDRYLRGLFLAAYRFR